METAVRIPPQNQDAEQNVLGAMLLSSEAVGRVAEILQMPGAFYRQSHQVVFEAIRDLFERGHPVDLVTVAEFLESRSKLDEVGGRLFLADLANSVATAVNVEYWARIVAQKAILRALINAATEIQALAYAEDEDVEVVLDEAEKKIFEVAQRRSAQDLAHIERMLHDAFVKIEHRFEQQGDLTGTPSGFYDLDSMTAGFQPGNLVIVGARPAMGKTSFAMSLAQHAATGSGGVPGRPVVIFSLEMSREELVMRMLCSEAMVNSQRVKTGMLTEEDWPKLGQAVGRLADLPVYIDDTSQISVMEVRSKCRRLMAELGGELGLIVIDYLQLMEARASSKSKQIDNRTNEVSYISRSLKALARELKCPVLALSQLARASEQSKDKRPLLSHLRESGAIEQDADIVMFIHRDDYYNEDSEFRNQAEIIVAKHRNGPTGTVNLYFHKEFTRFASLAAPQGGF